MPPPKLSFKSWDCALDRTRRRHWDTLERSGGDGDGGGLGELLLPPPLLLSLELPFPLWVLGFMAMFCFVSLVRLNSECGFYFIKESERKRRVRLFSLVYYFSFLAEKVKKAGILNVSMYVWWLWKYLLLYVPFGSVRFGSVIRTGGLFYFIFIYIYI